MAINVLCGCGKKTMVSDALAGKMMRCPGCGNEVPVAAGRPGAKGGAKNQKSGPAFQLSGGQMILIVVVGAVLLIGGGFYFGPMRVSSEWSAMQPKATQDVQDLVIDSLREHMKQEDIAFDMKATPRRQPTVESHDVTFLSPMLAFSMPDQVGFIGKSNQGTFGGNYNTHTGEVDATVSYGGYTVGGMVDVAKPKGTFHLKGRMVNGHPQMEMDGKKI
jgi:hypothetical protein